MSAAHVVTLLAVNDFLSKLSPFRTFVKGEGAGEVGGLARIAGAVRRVREERPGQCLALVAGLDLCGHVAELFGGEAEARCLEAAGIDAAVPGIHEFASGPDRAAAMFSQMPFPVLCANLRPLHPALRGAFTPWAVFETARAKVGVLGLDMLPPTSLMLGGPTLDRLDHMDCARRAVQSLRELGCDVVAGLTHIGTEADRSLAAEVPGMHVIFGGHSHRATREPEVVTGPGGWRTLVLQAGTGGSMLGRLDLALGGDLGADPEHSRWSLTPMDSGVGEEPGVAALVRGYERDVAAHLRQPVTRLEEPVRAVRADLRRGADCAGNLLADALRASIGADIGLACAGHLRDGVLGPGAVSRGDVARLVPFETAVFELRVPGAILLDALALCGRAWAAAETDGFEFGTLVPDSFLQVSGLRVTYGRDGALRRAMMERDDGCGERDGGCGEVDPGATYRVALPSDMALGGFGYTMFQGLAGGNTGQLDHEAVAAFLARRPDPAALRTPRVEHP